MLVATVISMAHALGYRDVAEGAETDLSWCACALPCDYGVASCQRGDVIA